MKGKNKRKDLHHHFLNKRAVDLKIYPSDKKKKRCKNGSGDTGKFNTAMDGDGGSGTSMNNNNSDRVNNKNGSNNHTTPKQHAKQQAYKESKQRFNNAMKSHLHNLNTHKPNYMIMMNEEGVIHPNNSNNGNMGMHDASSLPSVAADGQPIYTVSTDVKPLLLYPDANYVLDAFGPGLFAVAFNSLTGFERGTYTALTRTQTRTYTQIRTHPHASKHIHTHTCI